MVASPVLQASRCVQFNMPEAHNEKTKCTQKTQNDDTLSPWYAANLWTQGS